jgi:MEMO1 family protein
MSNIDTSYVRPPAVAGSFYPGSSIELAKMLAQFFHDAPKPILSGKPLAIVSPHAGYIYSGAIAAKGYKIIEGEEYKTVIVISPSHTTYFKGVAAFGGKAYSTPLGEVPIDKELSQKIISHSDIVSFSEQGHFKGSGRSEHALEVQLPFLQTTLGKFSLVALVMGDQDINTCNSLGEAIAGAIGKRNDVLIVASSDLSHFHDGASAARLDSVVMRDIEKLNYHGLADDLSSDKAEACGGGPIIAAMIAATKLGANSALITGFGDSGDATGDKSSVVGYLSAILYKTEVKKVYEIENEPESKFSDLKSDDETKAMATESISDNKASGVEFGLSADSKKMLLAIARTSIEANFDGKQPIFPEQMPDVLKLALGAFVTLQKNGELRGCIGTFRANAPLFRIVSEMAREAAFSDYRFRPLTKSELSSIDIEISVLTPMKRIYEPDSVVVGRDGLYIKQGSYAGVLLPQVPVEQAWDRTAFLENTCLKAGLPAGSWRDKQTELYVFQAQIFGER